MNVRASLRGRSGSLKRLVLGTLPIALFLFGTVAAKATTVLESNLVHLIEEADQILVGTVVEVSDGFTDDNVPFTEVKLNVNETLRGGEDQVVTFRQFGLSKPRVIDGRTYLNLSPEGWPEWTERENVMVFLTKPARLTGLRTTVGLRHGKMRLRDGAFANETRNSGLFRGIQVTASGLTEEQIEMLSSDGQAADANPFITLVRRAVDENWVVSGEMRHAN